MTENYFVHYMIFNSTLVIVLLYPLTVTTKNVFTYPPKAKSSLSRTTKLDSNDNPIGHISDYDLQINHSLDE